MAMLVAPVVTQLSVLLALELILAGLAVNELIVGLLRGVTVTVSEEATETEPSVAVSV